MKTNRDEVRLSLSEAREREDDRCDCTQPFPDARGNVVINEACPHHGVAHADTPLAVSRHKPRKQVEGRVWKNPTFSAVRIDGVEYDNCSGWALFRHGRCAFKNVEDWMGASRGAEIFGPEADALVRECVSAMGLVPEDNRPHRIGWHPAPDLAGSLRYSEPVKKPERNWAALSEAAKKKPVGFYEDAPRGISFGGGKVAGERPVASPAESCAAPIPGALRGDDYRWYVTRSGEVSCVYKAVATGRKSGNRPLYDIEAIESRGHRREKMCGQVMDHTVEITLAQFIAKLREWKHPALAEFEAQPRKPVEGRVFKMNGTQSQGSTVSHWANIGGVSYWREYNGSWDKYVLESGSRLTLASCLDELHAPEADAIIRECVSAMGLEGLVHG